MTLAEIAAAVGGKVHDGDAAAMVTASARFDSRQIESGGLFVALCGERVDGHDFAGAAVAAGAVGVLGSRPVGVPAVVVDDVQAAYGRLARAVAARLTNTTIVGITGSAGKTTTKDLVAQVLARLGPTVAATGSRNNELGLPETVTLATADTRFLVLEMGARHIGDIAYLTSLVQPHVGIVLNVGTAHVGQFGSQGAIAQAKGELVEALPHDGLAVLNADDPLVSAMALRTRASVVTFGRGLGAQVRAEQVTTDEAGRARFTLCAAGIGEGSVKLQLHGEHLVSNALAAAAVALRHTHDVALVADALSAAVPVSAGRMQVIERADGVTVINDAYNANPASMAAALRTLAAMAGDPRRAVAVLGEMAELGDTAPEAHRVVGDLAAQLGVKWLIAVGGDNARELAQSASEAGVAVLLAPDREAASALLHGQLQRGDVVLVKGSNSMGLLEVATLLSIGD